MMERLFPSFALRRKVKELKESNAQLRAGYARTLESNDKLVRENQRLRRSNSQLKRGEFAR